MANITLLGASYTDVPAVTLPQTGGGTVTFYENGGGTSNYATGEITLSSDFSLTTSAQNIPGLQLPFQPDYFFIIMNRSSFTSKGSYSSGLYGLCAWKKSWSPPVATSSSNIPETTSGDYVFFVHTNVTSSSSITCGYGISNPTTLGTSYYSRYGVNSNGTISVGRYSSASTKMFKGTYRYFACKIS